MEAVQVAEGASGYKMRVDATLNVIHQRDPGILTVKKVDFIVFIAQVINCIGQTKKTIKETRNHCEGGKNILGSSGLHGRNVTGNTE